MGIPDAMLPHTVTKVRPAVTTSNYGNTAYDYGVAATRTDIRAWLQQNTRAEPRPDGREALEQSWLLMTNDPDVQGIDRIEFDALTFGVEGPPGPYYTPAGFHHTEATLRIVDG